MAEALGDPGARIAALSNLALTWRSSGDIERALGHAQTARALSLTQGDRHREAAIDSNLADLLHSEERHTESMLHLKQAVAIYAEIGVEEGAIQPAIWKLSEW